MSDGKGVAGVVPGILVLTHGRAGEELIRSAEMIIGPVEGMSALALMPGMAPEEFMADVVKILQSMPDGTLLISDLFGGTPANVSAAVSCTRNICAVSGLSLNMLIEAATARNSLNGEKLAEAVVSAGRDGCQNILAALRDMD